MKRSMGTPLAFVVFAIMIMTGATIAAARTCCISTVGSGCTVAPDKVCDMRTRAIRNVAACEKGIAALYGKYEDEFAAIHKKHEDKIIELTEKIESLEREIDKITMDDEPDLGKLESSLRKISDARVKLTELRFRMHKEARAVVDEEDRAALDRHFAMGVGCCGGTGMRAFYHPDRATDKFEIRPCCPGREGHASLGPPGAIFVGEKDGRAAIELLDDDDLDRDVRRVMKKVSKTPGGVTRLEADGPGIVRRVRTVPGEEPDAFIWHERGGSAGPF